MYLSECCSCCSWMQKNAVVLYLEQLLFVGVATAGGGEKLLYLGLLVLLLLEVENCSSLLFPLAGVLLVLDMVHLTERRRQLQTHLWNREHLAGHSRL